jgi:hypothetical protein
MEYFLLILFNNYRDEIFWLKIPNYYNDKIIFVGK